MSAYENMWHKVTRWWEIILIILTHISLKYSFPNHIYLFPSNSDAGIVWYFLKHSIWRKMLHFSHFKREENSISTNCRVIEHEKRWLHTSHWNWNIVSWCSVSACHLTSLVYGNLFSHTLHGNGECFYIICLLNLSTHETLFPHTLHGLVFTTGFLPRWWKRKQRQNLYRRC